MTRALAGLALAAAAALAAGPKIFYSKSFPGSEPAYVAVELDRSGAATYKESPDDDGPLRFQLEEAETGEIFALAEKLDYFRRPLEANLKVANMGIKTFRYEDGTRSHQVQFNYSEDPDAKLLADWFERLTETARHRILLERSYRFDRLGVDKALLLLEASFAKNRLAGAKQLLPVLEKIAQNPAFFNRARERAARLSEFIRAGKTRAE
ncbi:MAG: hypothetical protein RMK57_02015 [Bryobacterales bacterium]|nr:hypothetical protein [Bryobacteraceae bacterium]MDW8353280.1 hypothetical protein [Bryobacterales bacterium]